MAHRACRAPIARRIRRPREPRGSNGIAIAPANTRDHHALLLINPHTSFFFRSELQVTSDEGLDAYGAATWGQFFLYQGFNERLGWMHTSSGVDNVDFFRDRSCARTTRYYYRYGRELRPVPRDPDRHSAIATDDGNVNATGSPSTAPTMDRSSSRKGRPLDQHRADAAARSRRYRSPFFWTKARRLCPNS